MADDEIVLYLDGVPASHPATIAEAAEALAAALAEDPGTAEQNPGTAVQDPGDGAGAPAPFLWADLSRPDAAELARIAEAFDLHPLAVEDAVEAHQRPKLDQYGAVDLVVLRPAHLRSPHDPPDEAPLDDPHPTAGSAARIRLGELHLFLGASFVLIIRQSRMPAFTSVRRTFENDPRFPAQQPFSALYRVLDAVVDGYPPILDALEDAAADLEDVLFSSPGNISSQSIYRLKRRTMELNRAVAPMEGLLSTLLFIADDRNLSRELGRGLRDVADHVRIAVARVDRLDGVLRELLSTNSAMISEVQNEQMKRISGWAGIFFFPTLIAGVYGMNFAAMPELHWVWGYPFALGLMLGGSLLMYVLFKRRGWL